VGPGFSPLDRELALPAGSLTPQLAEWVVRLGTWMPFAQVARLLAAFWQVTLSAATVRRTTESAGAVLVAHETAAAATIRATLPAPPSGPPRALVSVDGAMVPLVGGQWAEVKTLVIGQVERQPSADGPVPHTSALSYFSRLTDAATFEHLSVVETQRRGLDHAGQVAAVTDGAEWIPSWLQPHVPGAVRILDLPHAVEHLSAMANAIWGEGSAAGQAWVTAQTHQLKHAGGGPVLAEVRRQAAAHPTVAAIAEQGAYLAKREAALDYPTFAAAGWPLGSGVVESANKLVVEARLKGAGMHWARAHVNPLLSLRNAACNDRWAECWATVRTRQRAEWAAHCWAGQERRRRGHGAESGTGVPDAESAASTAGPRPGRPAGYGRAGRTGPKEPWRPAADHPWRRPLLRPQRATA
jgi:hypothetical protein